MRAGSTGCRYNKEKRFFRTNFILSDQPGLHDLSVHGSDGLRCQQGVKHPVNQSINQSISHCLFYPSHCWHFWSTSLTLEIPVKNTVYLWTSPVKYRPVNSCWTWILLVGSLAKLKPQYHLSRRPKADSSHVKGSLETSPNVLLTCFWLQTIFLFFIQMVITIVHVVYNFLGGKLIPNILYTHL